MNEGDACKLKLSETISAKKARNFSETTLLQSWSALIFSESALVQCWSKFITFSSKIYRNSLFHTVFNFTSSFFVENFFSIVFPFFVTCSQVMVKKNGCYTNSNFWQKFGWKEFSYNLNTLIPCLFGDHIIFPNTIRAFFDSFSILSAALIDRKSELIRSGLLRILWINTEQWWKRQISETALFRADSLRDFNPGLFCQKLLLVLSKVWQIFYFFAISKFSDLSSDLR